MSYHTYTIYTYSDTPYTNFLRQIIYMYIQTYADPRHTNFLSHIIHTYTDYACSVTPYTQLPMSCHTHIRVNLFWHPAYIFLRHIIHEYTDYACSDTLHPTSYVISCTFTFSPVRTPCIPTSCVISYIHIRIIHILTPYTPTSYDISYTNKFTPVLTPHTPTSYATSCKHIQTMHILTPYTPSSYDISYTHTYTPILTPCNPNAGNDTAAWSCGTHLQLPFVTRPVFCVHICVWLTCV